MYFYLLGLHSWTRWILILCILVLLIRSLSAYRKSTVYGNIDLRLATSLFWVLNLQFVLGLALYLFFSPITQAGFGNLSEAFSDATLRFFVIEHPLAMFLAIGAGHSGLKKARLATDPRKKHGQILKGVGACLFFILVGIPWPFLPYGKMLYFL